MFAFLLTAIATFLLLPPSIAQDENRRYTLWSSVIFSRTGDRTPEVLGDLPVELTTLGARQAHDAGLFMRERYLTSFGSYNGLDSAPIQGLDPNNLDSTQVYVQALDLQYSSASAQAFVQGLYPPYTPDSNSSEVMSMLDATGLLANQSYIVAPLGGYQYPQIQTADGYSPEYVYLAGMYNCPAFDYAVANYQMSSEAAEITADSEAFYETLGGAVLSDVMPDPDDWSYWSAYTIYDYVSYQHTHNYSFYPTLFANTTFVETLRYLADKQQFGWLGNQNAYNNITSDPFPGATGSVSTIAGNFLASKMLGQLQQAIKYQGEYYKLNLLFGDFQPLMSLFSLLSLPDLNENFYSMPNFASMAGFELYSITDVADIVEFPEESDLYVRFYFRNGTDPEEEYQAYPLFHQSPDQFEMPWTDFQNSMYDLIAGDVGEWCSQCGSTNYFCAYWNSSESLDAYSSSSSGGHHLSPAVGGVIGAIVALVIAGIIFGAVMLIGGVRFHRVQSKKSELGGFKGSQKMASDKDLIIPKGGAVVGASVVETPGSPRGGHERVGSWELKQNEAGMPNIAAPTAAARRPSFEDDDVGAAPFRRPTLPDERV